MNFSLENIKSAGRSCNRNFCKSDFQKIIKVSNFVSSDEVACHRIYIACHFINSNTENVKLFGHCQSSKHVTGEISTCEFYGFRPFSTYIYQRISFYQPNHFNQN